MNTGDEIEVPRSGTTTDTDLVLRLLCKERDRVAKEIATCTEIWSQPDCPKYAWFDREAFLAEQNNLLALCEAAIERRAP